MNKTRFLAAAFVAALLSLSTATAATAYAPPAFDGEGPSAVTAGGRFTVRFSANVTCAWTATFVRQKGAPGSGRTYSPTFTAPRKPGTYTVTAFCTWDPATQTPILAPITTGNAVTTASTASTAADTLLAASQTDTYTVQIKVGDAAADDDSTDDSGSSDGSGSEASEASDTNGILPDTGGESLAYLVAGGALVAVGAGVTIAARRRKTT